MLKAARANYRTACKSKLLDLETETNNGNEGAGIGNSTGQQQSSENSPAVEKRKPAPKKEEHSRRKKRKPQTGSSKVFPNPQGEQPNPQIPATSNVTHTPPERKSKK